MNHLILNKIIVVLFIGLMLIIGVYHTYGITPFLRRSYTIEAWWQVQNIKCNSTVFENSLQRIIQDYGSLSNQIILMKKNGESISCNSGNNVFTDTRFRYASLTKVITAALVLESERVGDIKLDDMLSEYIQLSQVKDTRVQNIKLYNLLNHTSGFDRLRSRDPMIQEGKRAWCPYDLEKLNYLRLDHSPGKFFSYDNRNYCLVAVVLERVTHQSFEALLQQYLEYYNFRNIKLLKGPFLNDEVKYDFRYEKYYFPSYAEKFDFHAMQAVAGLSGSASDYAKLIHFFLYERRLPLIENITQYKNTKGELVNLTIALRQKKMKTGEEVFYHTGALPAARSLLIIRENGDIIVWLGSGVPADPNLETEDLMEVILSNIN